MGAVGFLRVRYPRKLLADFFFFFFFFSPLSFFLVWSVGKGLGLLEEMWPLPFLKKDGINDGLTLQGIFPSWLSFWTGRLH
jgi:hypothetical protein